MPDLITEKVQENYHTPGGNMGTREFWIAYPDHVLAYGSMGERINRSAGRGKTEAEALADARKNGGTRA